ncbi:MAG: oligosaccharide flippase family protein [Parcubacteria group bacterium]|jgi:O-antigen/teichoic acid export membrane protein
MFNFLKKTFLNGGALAKNSAILFAGIMGASVLNYVFHLVIGRMVSVEEYGKIESLNSLIYIILIPTATLTMIVTKYGAGFKAQDDRAGNRAFGRYLEKKLFWYGLPVFAFFLLITPYVGNFLKIEERWPLIMLWILMFISFFAAVNSGILNGWQKFKNISVMNVLGAAVKLVFCVILLKIGFALSGVIGSFVLGGIASYIASVVALRFIFSAKVDKLVKPAMQESLKAFIVPFFIGNLAVNILGNADMILAKHILDPTQAGQYGALTIVSKIILFATGVIATVLFSISSENHHKKIDSFAIFKNASCIMLAISLGAVIFYFLFPGFILKMLFGNKYVDIAGFLGWFAIMAALFSYLHLIFQYLLSIQKTKIVYSLLMISFVSSLLILFTGHDIYGILKVAIISQIMGIIVGVYYILKAKDGKQRKTDFNYNPGV